MASNTDNIFVAAIDIGTTYSGYAFSLKHDPLEFYFKNQWNSAFGGMVSKKTPTTLLLNPDKTFNSFGFEAEETYASLAVEHKHHELFFFQKFKMDLHFQSLRKNSIVNDILGKPVSALKVFSLSIKFLKDDCIQLMKDRGFQPEIYDIQYVLTVPAIWSDRSKQFMRTAAIEAGIRDCDLTLALEPEAASIYCQRVPLEKLSERNESLRLPGKQYIVADIGGGTADFCVHRVNEDNSLTELFRASGGPHGGIYVDKEYLKIYDIIFGTGTVEKLKYEEMDEYLELTSEFEMRKRMVALKSKNSFRTKVTGSLFEKNSEKERLQAIESSFPKGYVELKTDKLKLSPTLMTNFFEKSLKDIVNHIQEILKVIPNIDNILLVGGYCESLLLQETFKQEFGDKIGIIIPQETSLAVVKGAVLFGHNPQSITARILRFSYGVATHPTFDSSIHPQESCYFDNEGRERCRDAFKLLIKKGATVSSKGITSTFMAVPLYGCQKSCSLRLYCTEKDNPVVIDESFPNLGTLQISAPEPNQASWKADIAFVTGMTELKIYTKITENDNSFQKTFDLLE